MIAAALLSPLVILVMDWAIWGRLDMMMSFPSMPWRLRQRRWKPWLAAWVWSVVALILGNRAAPDWEAILLFGVGMAVLVWWWASIYADLRE